MRKLSNNYFSNLNTTEVVALTAIVKETIALDIKTEVKKNFTAAQLWDIQKRRRNFVQRRLR